MQSLKDKLLKAGLVSEEQVKKADAEKAAKAVAPPRAPPRPPPARPGSARPAASRPHHEAPIPKFAPLSGSKEANRQLARQQLELDRALREKVLAAEVPVELGTATFHFVTRKGKLRRLDLSEAQQKQLESGALAVVERPDPDQIAHALVPAAVAVELKALSERSVRFLNQEGSAVGFLSEDELQRRLAEPEVAEAPEAPQAPETPAEAAPSDAPKDGETWLTIRRAPEKP